MLISEPDQLEEDTQVVPGQEGREAGQAIPLLAESDERNGCGDAKAHDKDEGVHYMLRRLVVAIRALTAANGIQHTCKTYANSADQDDCPHPDPKAGKDELKYL